MWLSLRSIGYSYVAVLQGGFVSWEEQGMPVTASGNEVIQKPDNSLNQTTYLGGH